MYFNFSGFGYSSFGCPDKGSDIYFDPQGLEGAVFNWNGQKDYSQYIYNAMLYMRSGSLICCVVNDDGKKKILEHVQEAP
ncbi:TPA: hypothetical protein NVQ95_000802 [Acinetobacter baumannii]|nr:hypothetical protein [Acinetobacter baumannii]HCJ6619097.1 hypothetical protein [Acinetobacter baumannii]HCJ6708545.1 hypothetical protein [Acinetobacter baumannii]HCJ6716908.1 hypothetical protein [Acinetobacter baumannii]HCJ6763464.1 hypothetical protein [Acinetobacter baumannii]